MQNLIMLFLAAGASVLNAGLAYAGGGTALTYQGRLLDAGEPANGVFFVEFSLWDQVAGGIQVGSTVTFNSLPISDGLLTAEVDFGANAFDNTDRWLDIAVDGVSLTPRQPMTRAPYAIQTRGIIVNDDQHVGMGVNPGASRLRVWNFAGNAFEAFSSNRAIEAITTAGDMAILASNQSADGMAVFAQHQSSQNQGWLGTPDYGVYGRANDVANDWAGYFLGRAHVSDTLFVGRETPITSAEVFGIHRNTSSFGGMYISTSSQAGLPFYGYAAGGDVDAYHYYDGGSGKWHLLIGNVNRLTVQSDGNVGIGTTAPGWPLEVVSAGSRTIFAHNTADSGATGVWGESESTDGRGVLGFVSANSGTNWGVWGESASTNGRGVFGFTTANSGINYGVRGASNSTSGFDFFASGAGTNYGSSSSIRWKSNIRNIDQPLEKVARLRGVYFDWDKDHGGHHDVGMIAEEVGEVVPEIVNYEENGIDAIGMDYSKLTPLLVKAVNALRVEKDEEIDSLRAENDALRARLDSLENLVERLAGAETEKTTK